MEFVSPSTLASFELLFQVLDDRLVRRFGLSIALRVPWGGEAQLDLPPNAKLLEVARDELQTVIHHEHLRYAEPTDNISPDEVLDVRVFDLHVWLRFNPLCKVVGEDEQILTLYECSW